VWGQQERIVISDIDGTITKSDVRGMLLPMIGESKSTHLSFINHTKQKYPGALKSSVVDTEVQKKSSIFYYILLFNIHV
jgi:hypothetical protein